MQNEEVETVYGNYQISETPIDDRSVLGTQGQKLCDNIDVYWMTPGLYVRACVCVSLCVGKPIIHRRHLLR